MVPKFLKFFGNAEDLDVLHWCIVKPQFKFKIGSFYKKMLSQRLLALNFNSSVHYFAKKPQKYQLSRMLRHIKIKM